jgi:hypothetical protein
MWAVLRESQIADPIRESISRIRAQPLIFKRLLDGPQGGFPIVRAVVYRKQQVGLI